MSTYSENDRSEEVHDSFGGSQTSINICETV